MSSRFKYLIAVLLAVYSFGGVCHADVAADLENCRKLYDSGHYDEVIQTLVNTKTTDPALAPQILKLLGHCYSQRRMCNEGIECYSKLLRTYPDSVAPNRKVKRWMMECYLEDYKTDEALVKIESLLLDYPRDSAEHHYFTGRRHHLHNEYAEAALEYEKAIKLNAAPKEDPIVKDAKHRLIECYLARGEKGKADDLFQRTLKEYPEDVGTLHFIVGRRLFENGDCDGAITELKQAIELNKAPKNVTITKHIRRWRMVSYITKGNLQDALAELRIIIADYPREASTFIVEEWPRWQDKWLPYAITELKKASEECVPGSNSSRYLKKELMDCYIHIRDEQRVHPIKEGSDEQVYSLATAMVDEFPDEAASYLNLLASWYKDQGKAEEAEKEIRKALDLCAGLKTDLTRRLSWQVVDYYTGQGDWKKVISVVQDMLRDYPDDTLALELRLILAYLDDRQYEKCILICKDILTDFTDPNASMDALIKLTECMYYLGEGEEGIAYQDEFFRQHPDWKMEADYVRAMTAHHAQRDYSRAADLLDKFIADYPKDGSIPEARKRFAYSLVFSGQTARAVEALRYLLNTAAKRNKAAVMVQIADVYFRAKRFNEALKEYKEVRNLKEAPDELKARAIYQSGLCYRETGYQKSAEQCMDMVIKRYSASEWARQARGQLYLWGNLRTAGRRGGVNAAE